MLLYLFRYAEIRLMPMFCSKSFGTDPRGRLSQVGSLAGAAHLLNGNAGVLR